MGVEGADRLRVGLPVLYIGLDGGMEEKLELFSLMLDSALGRKVGTTCTHMHDINYCSTQHAGEVW